jgi:methionyl-tRNA formyltransferase
VAVPAKNENSVFISSGTWSLLGVESNMPLLTEQGREANFTNEGGIEGTYRILKNIMGLWMLQNFRKEINTEDFSLPAKQLDCIIRGVTPIPGAFAYHKGKMLKINKALPIDGKGKPGEVIDLCDKGEGYVTVACGEGALRVTQLIPEGKGRMTAGDFVRGRKISLGDILE